MIALPFVRRSSLLTACALFGFGCSNDTVSSLVNIASVDAGDDCAAGGIMLETGLDTNGDGILQADEVISSEAVCEGEQPAASLLTTTELSEGDDDCEYGGLRIDAGLDDGDPGGTAHDNTLQDEEIDSTELICNGAPGEEGASGSEDFIPIEPPAGPLGAYTMNLSGGNGSARDGGEGGYFDVEMEYGSIGGGIRIYNTGVADGSWDYPASVSYHLGDNPVTVTTNTTLTVLNDVARGGLTTGELYVNYNDNGNYTPPTLYVWNGTEGDQVTGLSIAAGATLTIPQTYLRGGGFELETDLHVAGTLTTTLTEGDRTNLYVNVGNFIGESTGSVVLTGADNSGGTGGAGGDLYISAEEYSMDFEEDPGAIFNQASIDTSGGDGQAGGQGGDVDWDANFHIMNTATITTGGGTGSDGSGGNGGDVDIDNDYADNLNSGDIDTSGGSGNGDDGGDGGYVYFYNGYWGNVVNSGNLTGDGGDAIDCSSCYGGDAGYAEFYVYSNPITSSGNISMRGGDALGSSSRGETYAYGGDGGYVYLQGDYEDGYALADYVPLGDWTMSGNIDVSGGDGEYGGDAGYFEVDMDLDYVPDNQQFILYGYTDIDMSGGDGLRHGGDADYAWIFADYADGDYPVDYGPGGSVANYANFDLSGGNGTEGDGGNSYYFEMLTEYDYGYAADWQIAVNHGNINASGGNGTSGGEGGAILLYGYNGVENTGNLTADGGDASGVESSGGCAACYSYDEVDYGINLISDNGTVSNTGDLSANGGNATGNFGYGGDSEMIQIVGRSVINSGNIYAAGGNATGTSSYGGDADYGVLIHSLYGTSEHTGTIIDVSGGTGTDAEDGEGDSGLIFIDGQNVTDDYSTTTTR